MSVDKMTFRDIDGKKPEKEITVTCLEFPLAEDEKGEYQSSKIKWIDSLICKEGSSPIFNDKFREGLSFHLVRSVSEFVDTLPKTTPLDSSSSLLLSWSISHFPHSSFNSSESSLLYSYAVNAG